jgi:hypothetical protein
LTRPTCYRRTLAQVIEAGIRISASNAARDRNSLIKAHQTKLQRSVIGSEYPPIRGRGQPSWPASDPVSVEQPMTTVRA